MQQNNRDSRHLNSLEVTVSGQRTRLSFEETGCDHDFSVLLLHGWGSSAALMRPISNWLSHVFHVINLDLPGHGLSPPPPSAWGVPEHSDAIRQLLDKCVPGRFAIVGHSNGGRIALYMASEPSPPTGLVKLILISPSGVRRRRTIKYHLRRIAAAVLKAPFRLLPKIAREFGFDWLRHSIVWRLLGSSDYRSLEGVMRETFVRTVNCYLEERLALIPNPVLLFHGEEDQAVSFDQITLIEKSIPDAGLITIPSAGHFSFMDQPDVFRPAILHFLLES